MSAVLRAEGPGDRAALASLIETAFAGHPHSDGTEAGIVDGLRAAGALAVSLVAVIEDRMVGHVAFSRVSVGEGDPHWYALGPLCVAAGARRTGVGAALVREGLARIEALGAAGCLLVGDPAYYVRFGFAPARRLRVAEPMQPFLQVRVLRGGEPDGAVAFHPAFGA